MEIKPFVIGLTGVAGAGKSTVAAIIQKAIAKNWSGSITAISPMAKPIKDACIALGLNKERDPDLYRATAQSIGQGLRELTAGEWWIQKQISKINGIVEHYQNPRTVVIIDDIRYVNEVEMVDRHFNGILIHVTPGIKGARRELTSNQKFHDSEYLGTRIEQEVLQAYNVSAVEGDEHHRYPVLVEAMGRKYRVLLNVGNEEEIIETVDDILRDVSQERLGDPHSVNPAA